MRISGNWTIEGLFIGRPESLKLFNIVRQYIESLGSVVIVPSKTQISFGTNTKFAWVWLPQLWIKKRNENSITLTFDVDHHIHHEIIVEAVEPRHGHWIHHIVIENESDFNIEIREWLLEAYTLSQTKK